MAQIYAPKAWATVSGPVAEWCRKLAEAVDQLANGSSRTVGSVTLTANAASTTVTNTHVTPSSHVTLTPITANAATEYGAGTWRISTRTNGTSFVITHVNNAQTDRTFTYEVRNP
jgi:hypothetical protein